MLLTHTFVPVTETRISILFLAKRGVEDLNLWSPFRDSVLAGQCIQPNSANTSNSSVVQYYLIITEYKQILTSIIFCLSKFFIVVFSLAGDQGIEPQYYGFGDQAISNYLYSPICRVTLKLNSGLRFLYLF